MPDGSGTLLARTLVGRDAELGALQDAWRDGGAAQVVTAAGRGRQEPAGARAGVVGADERRAGARRALQPDRAGHAAAAVARGAPRRGPGRADAGRRPRRRSSPRWRGWCPSGARPPTTPRPSCSARRCCGCCRRGPRRARPPCSWSRTSTGPTPSRSPCSSTSSTTWPARRCSWSPRSGTASRAPGTDLAADLIARRAALAGAPRAAHRRRGAGRRPLLPRRRRPARRRRRRARGAQRGRAVPRGGAARHRGALRVGHHHRRRARLGHRVGGDPARRPPAGGPAAAHRRRAARPPLRLDASRPPRSGLDDDEAAELLRQAVRAQLVDVEGAGFRFRHALTRDAVLAAALPTEQVGLAGRALDALLAADPELPGERCPLAAQLAARRRRAGPRRRPCGCGRPSARSTTAPSPRPESLATRARETGTGDTRHAADLVLLRACAQSGQTARAARAGHRAAGRWAPIPSERADVHLVLGAADLAAGRWDDAEDHASATRIARRGRPRPPGPGRCPGRPGRHGPRRSPTSRSPSPGPPSTEPARPTSRRWSARRSR